MLQNCRLRAGPLRGCAVVEGHGLARARHLCCAVTCSHPPEIGFWGPLRRKDWSRGIVVVVVLPVAVQFLSPAHGPKTIHHAGHKLIIVVQRILVVENIGVGRRTITAAPLTSVHRVLYVPGRSWWVWVTPYGPPSVLEVSSWWQSDSSRARVMEGCANDG